MLTGFPFDGHGQTLVPRHVAKHLDTATKTFLPAGMPVLKLRGDFAFFCPTGATCSTDCCQIWYGGGKQQSSMPCQISGRSVHIWGFLTQKNFKNPEFCKRIRPIRANP